MNKLFFSLCLLFLQVACTQPHKIVVFDNSSDSWMTIEVNSILKFVIEPYESIHKVIKYGDVNLIVNEFDTLSLKLDPNFEYLINPSKERYYLQDIYYFTSLQSERLYQRKVGQITSFVEGYKVKGNFELIDSSILLKRRWIFGLDEKPDRNGRILTNREKEYYKLYKIHRKKELTDLIDFENITNWIYEWFYQQAIKKV